MNVTMLDIGAITVADDNLRRELGDLTELSASIKSLGVLEPLLVREGDHLVVAGARRLEAARLAGKKQVPVILRAFTDSERLETMIVENLLREDITPLEEAEGYRRLKELGQTQMQIAARVGRNQSHISKRLALLELPEPAQRAVESGAIRLDVAQQLSKIKGTPEAVERIVKETVAAVASRPDDRSGREIANSAVERKVAAELEAQERAKKVKATVAELKKKGEKKVVPIVGDGWKLVLPKGYKPVLPLAFADDDIEMPLTTHQKLDCHAVGVNPRTAEVVELCSKPATHPTRGQRTKARAEREAAEQAKLAAEHKAALQRRREFVQGLCKGTIDKALLLELVYINAFEKEHWGWEGAACALLTITDKEREEGKAADLPADPIAQLQWYAERSQANRLRVTMALTLGRLETHYRSPIDYLTLLVKRGYEPTADERKRLAEADKSQEALVA